MCNHPYLPFYSLVIRLLNSGEKLVENHQGFLLWTVDNGGMKITATCTVVGGKFIFPVEIFLTGNGYSLGSKQGIVRLKYSTIRFQPSDPVSVRRLIQPSGIYYSEYHYDIKNKIVSLKFPPQNCFGNV